ncbi:hypothetical protein BRARA_E01459 [Brassica rapa]|uniref:Uncharacterized protein n=2 Tax=Brassica TaxID=3705 RepID=A0A397ZJ00_BRACM|nr:hypothetical protein BRARA_E01459 [Brassica rapa]CAF2097173.1 unnamed protein product [Brassica napus]CAG7875277.1 unnamed protein product [Brassica rapa]CDY08247.1 BnaA05g13720D [Brassica napus]VDC70924.1 unnamed protein product [Brassica rapa]
MNRQVLSIVALILLLLLSAFNSTTMARTLPNERISASIKVGVSGSVSRQARKKGPGAPGKQNR